MQQSYEEIKKEYPNEWLILGDPVMSADEQRVLSAVLLYHSPSKLELVNMDKPLMHVYKNHATLYNGPLFATKNVLVGGRSLGSVDVNKKIAKEIHRPIKSMSRLSHTSV